MTTEPTPRVDAVRRYLTNQGRADLADRVKALDGDRPGVPWPPAPPDLAECVLWARALNAAFVAGTPEWSGDIAATGYGLWMFHRQEGTS